MCHTSVLAWAATLPADLVTGRTVLEVGSYDVNGTVRPILGAHGPASYLGVDIQAGPGVDLVADVADLPGMYPDGFGLVVSTEMLEHVQDWRAAVTALVDLVAPGGALVLSTRSPGFPYHPHPIDAWRYPVPVVRQILEATGMSVISCEDDPEAPGVFAVAIKPIGWVANPGSLDAIEVPVP